MERVILFREGRLNREDVAFLLFQLFHIYIYMCIYIDIYIYNIYIYIYIYIYNVLSEKAFFKIFILFSGLLSQSSFVHGDFKCSFKSLQSSFENHNS